MPELLEEMSRKDKETRVLFPETHTEVVDLLGQKTELRPLPIAVSKKLSVRMVPLNDLLEKARADSSAADPDLDIKTIDTLIDCAMILVNYYKLPFTRERVEEDLSVEELLSFLSIQVSLSKENNFLLQSLRMALRMVEWTSMMYLRSLNPPSTSPTASDGESISSDSPSNTPSDSSSSSTTEEESLMP